MLSKIILSMVVVLGAASAALAASKHPVQKPDRTVHGNAVAPGGYTNAG